MTGAIERVVDGVQAILATPKPKIDAFGGINAMVRVPPVAVFGECFLDDHIVGDGFFHPDDVTPDLHGEVNCALVTPAVDDPTVWVLNWVRTPSKEERRRAKRHARFMLAYTNASFKDGRWLSFETRLQAWLGGRWTDAIGARLGHHGGAQSMGSVAFKSDGGQHDHGTIQMMLSLALHMRYSYSAVLTEDPRNLSARIYADPRTLRFMLRTRELGNAARRRALMHLVRSHSRRRKRQFQVRNHLRGEHTCRWAGLDVRVLPSQYDAELVGSGAALARLNDDGLLRYVPALTHEAAR